MQNRRHLCNLIWKWMLFFFIIYLGIICIFHKHNTELNLKRFEAQPFELYQCPLIKPNYSHRKPRTFGKNIRGCKTPAKRILLIASTGYGHHLSTISPLLNYLKVPIRIEVFDNDELLLEIANEGRFASFIFEDYRTYDNLPSKTKSILLKYCQEYGAGLISFLLYNTQEHDFQSFSAKGGKNVEALEFSTNSPVNFIAKSSIELSLNSSKSNWTFFNAADKNVTPILEAVNSGNKSAVEILVVSSNVQHIIFGHELDHWMLKIAFMDALIFIMPNITERNLERFIQLDIDDVFLGQKGTKFTPEDVNNLLETQKDLRQFIDGFTFLLGFSGYFFRHGDYLDAAGDEQLVASSGEFLWFPHMWHHNHAHEYSLEYLRAVMTQNKMFAANMKLNMSASYAISPQHSGVYPIYKPLFQAWRTIWNISVTSTEEYPHFRPPSARRGFVYSNVYVLPRQVCGLFTHTLYFHAYPGGVENLYANVFGGELFETVLMNKFSIFMTHQQNYANDRLASFTFRNLVRFLRCWTNLKLKWEPPIEIARRYFEQYPHEKKLIYTNLCSDQRHRLLLSLNSTCNKVLPNVLVLGPQKTGTSALSLFLSLHPDVTMNQNIPKFYEELQFFNGANYARGVDWYSDKFSLSNNTSIRFNENGSLVGERNYTIKTRAQISQRVIFEKSANYFDSAEAPAKLKALIPDARLIIILMNPVDRAYSWYQHMRSHNDSTALNFSAEEVFMGNLTSTERLRRRCVTPGFYAKHLDRWLDYFTPANLILLDGEMFRHNPAIVMRTLMMHLNLSPEAVDFEKRLKLFPEKGFYCVTSNSKRPTCLGQTKGRKYTPMSDKLRRFLENFYEPHNKSLKTLLEKYSFSLPFFLLT